MTLLGYVSDPDLYDRVYADFTADVGFHLAEARAARGTVLEVCCGSGRILVPLRAAGIDIEGLDFAGGMLESARAKLARRGLAATLHLGDMRTFTLGRRFAHVFVPFNSFLHNLTQEDQLRTLVRCREHLLPGAPLTVVLYHPDAGRLAGFDGSETLWKELPEADGRRLRIFNSVRVDRVEQLQHLDRRVEVVDDAGRVAETHRYAVELRYVYKPEMELLLRTAGFARWDACTPISGYGGERLDPPRPPGDGGTIAWHAWTAPA